MLYILETISRNLYWCIYDYYAIYFTIYLNFYQTIGISHLTCLIFIVENDYNRRHFVWDLTKIILIENVYNIKYNVLKPKDKNKTAKRILGNSNDLLIDVLFILWYDFWGCRISGSYPSPSLYGGMSKCISVWGWVAYFN